MYGIWYLKNTSEKVDTGDIIETEESKFGKYKYIVGHAIEDQGLFDRVCCQTRHFFHVPVDSKDVTIINISVENIELVSTVISDCCKAYWYTQHGLVTAADKNTIAWKRTKAKVQVPYMVKYHFMGYLIQTIFQMNIPKEHLHKSLLALARPYPSHLG